jgi:hypothetical protein
VRGGATGLGEDLAQRSGSGAMTMSEEGKAPLLCQFGRGADKGDRRTWTVGQGGGRGNPRVGSGNRGNSGRSLAQRSRRTRWNGIWPDCVGRTVAWACFNGRAALCSGPAQLRLFQYSNSFFLNKAALIWKIQNQSSLTS